MGPEASLPPDAGLPIDPARPPDDPAQFFTQGQRRAHRDGRRARPGVPAAVALGGFLGTLGRYQVGLAWPTAPGQFPTATFTINTTGAFAIGVVVVILERRPRSRFLRPFAAAGLLGGWTTMSTLAVEAVTLTHDAHWAIAAGYLLASLVAGLGAVAAGASLGRRRGGPRTAGIPAR